MSRNYDELTTIPFVNSTMQEDFEGDHYRHIDKNPSSCPPGDEDIELEYRELEVELEHLQLDSDYSDSRSLAQYKQNKNSNKKVFKSFQEKYPISMPEISYFSKSSSSFVDNNFYEYDEDSKVSPRMKVNRREMSHKDFSKQDLHKIYQELNVIHNKLVDEYQILQEREEELKRREYKLKNDEDRLLKMAHLDTKLRLEEIKLNYDKEIDDLKVEFKEKFKDHKRLHEAFKTIKQTNEGLKQQLNEKQEKNSKLEKQNASLNNRLINFQKKIENTRPASVNSTVENQKPSSKHTTVVKLPNQQFSQQQTLIHNANILEAFALLLDWLGQVHLKENINFSLPISGNTQVLDKSCRLLPLLAELIIHLNSSSMSNLVTQSFQKYHLAFLEFIYWSLLHYDLSLQNAKVNLTTTFRRIGEELYRSYNKNYQGDQMGSTDLAWIKNYEFNNQHTNSGENVQQSCLFSLFLQGNNAPVRMLSCLIILRTLTQADYINNVYEILRGDLRDDNLKKLFLNYYGTWTIIKWCKLSNKHFLGCSIDTYLQLSSDWEYLKLFLESCSNETWFSHIAVIMKSTGLQNGVKLELTLLEKLSVMLQKLSKIRSNRKYFEMFSLQRICNDLLQKHCHDSNFMAMNLKSILFNLNEPSERT